MRALIGWTQFNSTSILRKSKQVIFFTMEKRGMVFKTRKSLYPPSSKKPDDSTYSWRRCLLPPGCLGMEDIPSQGFKNLESYPNKKEKVLFSCQVDFLFFFPPSTEGWYPVDDVAGLIGKECLGLWMPAWASPPFGDLLSILDVLWRIILCRFNGQSKNLKYAVPYKNINYRDI